MSRRRASERIIRHVGFQVESADDGSIFGTRDGAAGDTQERVPLLTISSPTQPVPPPPSPKPPAHRRRRHSERSCSSPSGPFSIAELLRGTAPLPKIDISRSGSSSSSEELDIELSRAKMRNDPELWKTAREFVQDIIDRAKIQAAGVCRPTSLKTVGAEGPAEEEARVPRESEDRPPMSDWEKRLRGIVYVFLSCFGLRTTPY